MSKTRRADRTKHIKASDCKRLKLGSCPTGKRTFKRKAQAVQIARLETQREDDGVKRNVYQCDYCHKFHLTRRQQVAA